MKAGKAFNVFCDINNPAITEEEKAIAIHEVMISPTHNSITKKQMCDVVMWLFNQHYEIVSTKTDGKDGESK